jgi:hypothetical protein
VLILNKFVPVNALNEKIVGAVDSNVVTSSTTINSDSIMQAPTFRMYVYSKKVTVIPYLIS